MKKNITVVYSLYMASIGCARCCAILAWSICDASDADDVLHSPPLQLGRIRATFVMIRSCKVLGIVDVLMTDILKKNPTLSYLFTSENWSLITVSRWDVLHLKCGRGPTRFYRSSGHAVLLFNAWHVLGWYVQHKLAIDTKLKDLDVINRSTESSPQRRVRIEWTVVRNPW